MSKVGEPMVYSIYVDLLFILNGFFDFILLYGVAMFTKSDYRIHRLLIAAMVGGIYGMFSLLPATKILYADIVILLFPFVLLAIAFGRISIEKLLKMSAYYYLLSFAMNGISGAGQTIFQKWGLAGDIFNLIFLPLVLMIIISKITVNYFKKSISKDNCLVSGFAKFENRKTDFKVFLDTGNNLKEPISGLPVMILKYDKIKIILPKELNDEFEAQSEEKAETMDFFAMVGEKYADTYWFNRISILPFSSVGKKQGYIIGFKPHCIQVKGKEIDAVLGIYRGVLGNDKDFDGILNPWVLEV